MAKFIVSFTDDRKDEEVTADSYEDVPPFVDFVISSGSADLMGRVGKVTVARYRADDIRRIVREDDE